MLCRSGNAAGCLYRAITWADSARVIFADILLMMRHCAFYTRHRRRTRLKAKISSRHILSAVRRNAKVLICYGQMARDWCATMTRDIIESGLFLMRWESTLIARHFRAKHRRHIETGHFSLHGIHATAKISPLGYNLCILAQVLTLYMNRRKCDRGRKKFILKATLRQGEIAIISEFLLLSTLRLFISIWGLSAILMIFRAEARYTCFLMKVDADDFFLSGSNRCLECAWRYREPIILIVFMSLVEPDVSCWGEIYAIYSGSRCRRTPAVSITLHTVAPLAQSITGHHQSAASTFPVKNKMMI